MSHVDRGGRARMVDVGGKPRTRRRAVAEGRVRMSREAFDQLRDNRLAKGDALVVARLAGIQAAKRTAEWIPLCHGIPLEHVDVEVSLDGEAPGAHVTASAAARGSTGVEMEALVAVTAACLTIYDMAKAVDRAMTIGDVRLLVKSGGRSGRWSRPKERGAR
jgi:cyclic pyranopterin phosphate synthase